MFFDPFGHFAVGEFGAAEIVRIADFGVEEAGDPLARAETFEVGRGGSVGGNEAEAVVAVVSVAARTVPGEDARALAVGVFAQEVAAPETGCRSLWPDFNALCIAMGGFDDAA